MEISGKILLFDNILGLSLHARMSTEKTSSKRIAHDLGSRCVGRRGESFPQISGELVFPRANRGYHAVEVLNRA